MKKCLALFFVLFCASALLYANTGEVKKASVEKKLFGKMENGKEVDLYTLQNVKGMQVGVITYGAVVMSVTAPDKKGHYADVVLGYDNLNGYLTDNSYFGAIVGRYANRIAKGKFVLDGKEYHLALNDGENHLHGGPLGIAKQVWDVTSAKASKANGSASITLQYVSKDGEGGYPGTMTVTVTYTLSKDDALSIKYAATSDKKTVINLTHHSYFNLSGDPTKPILNHELTLDANGFTPTDKTLIPTGVIAPVENTPMDFRKGKLVGKDIGADFEPLKLAGGYDHNWVLNKHGKKLAKCATVYEAESGRVMEVWTDQPGCQFYTGNFLNGSAVGKGNIHYAYRTGLCLEAQVYPDSPNKPKWPSCILEPGKVYHQTTIYKFSTK